jgi:hypothetical protein
MGDLTIEIESVGRPEEETQGTGIEENDVAR